ncbi:MAG: sulfatase-like hydrolase/transferase [Solirubrobacterales bacterium]|nr:sulfatase-like hydrolase/transferase [Solirubrobacterales bacterium]
MSGLVGALALAAIGRAPAIAEAKRPNIVVIQTDDQTSAMLHSRYVDRRGRRHVTMPRTLSLIGDRGVEFTNYYSSVPVCSPSRSTLLSGQYAHTSGLVRNVGILGGARGIERSDVYEENLATSLQAAGYHTAHFGRFVNGYGSETGIDDPTVPPGWDTWATDWTPGPVRRYYGYRLNVNGRILGPFGKAHYRAWKNKDSRRCPSLGLRCNYHADQIVTRAVRDIRRAPSGPIYVQIDHQAPHSAPDGEAHTEPARRHIGSAVRTPLPRPPGFNERDTSDKPRVLRRGAKPLEKSQIKRMKIRWRRELEALRAVDEGVGRIVRTLRQTGRLRNTYIIFVSDNGAFLGEHRYNRSKFLAYEPSTRVPLMITGPGVKRGTTSPAIVGNVDLAPTIADLAKADLQLPPDGRSMKPLLRHPRRVGHRSVILESYRLPSPSLNAHLEGEGIKVPEGRDAGISAQVPAVNYSAIRAGHYKYVKYAGGGRELYDLSADPHELANRIHWPGYARVARFFAKQLDRRQFCKGRECRKGVRNIPEPKLRRHRRPDKAERHPGKAQRHPGKDGGATPGRN